MKEREYSQSMTYKVRGARPSGVELYKCECDREHSSMVVRVRMCAYKSSGMSV